MNRSIHTFLALWAATSLSAAFAQFGFPDSSATSRDGKLRIDAKSAGGVDSEGFVVGAGQRFNYTLKALASGTVRWNRKQKEDEQPGFGVLVSNRGTVIILSVGDVLTLVNAIGQDIGEVCLHRGGFTERERKDFITFSTAGLDWQDFSKWYFIEHLDV
jgi:hypothetical protein